MKADGEVPFLQHRIQTSGRAVVSRRQDVGLAKRHDPSRNLIRIWVKKFEAGPLDEKAGGRRHDNRNMRRGSLLERLVGRQALELLNPTVS
jgi:hypothetical protein